MDSNTFVGLKELARILKKEEISIAKKFLIAFDSNVTRQTSKALKLFKLVLNKPEITREKAKKSVSKEISEDSFDRLVVRVKNKLLESLILDVNIRKKDAYPDWYRNKIELRKKILAVIPLMGRGWEKEAENIPVSYTHLTLPTMRTV